MLADKTQKKGLGGRQQFLLPPTSFTEKRYLIYRF